jgi:hypothetical protein
MNKPRSTDWACARVAAAARREGYTPPYMGSSTSLGFYWKRSKHYLLWTGIIALAGVWLSWYTRNSLPTALVGALLTLIGIPLTFSRLLRRGAAGSNDPEPPTVHPQKPGERLVQFNMAYMHSQVQGIVEKIRRHKRHHPAGGWNATVGDRRPHIRSGLAA